jgi:hypothetical protein
MKLIFSCLLLLSWPVIVQAQDQLTELDKRNGFKDIKMGMPVDSVPGIKLKKAFTEKGNYPAALYEVSHPNYQWIGEVKVLNLELKAYKDKVYEIRVRTEKDPRLMKALESTLGSPVFDVRNERYIWRGQNLSLAFKAVGKNELELLYVSHVMHAEMKADKKKKIDEIADDF